MSNTRKQHWPRGWKPTKLPDKMTKNDYEKLVEWMEGVCEWGEHLRDDLIRLEGSLGMSVGDPGDPPPPPWFEDDDDNGG